MQLSIIIVNFNVKFFLEQCLHSVKKAIQNIDAEVVVVDNNSQDGSVPFLKELFPWVHLIENANNVGFAVANNQALNIAKGAYILYLNPDTIIAESTIIDCIHFFETHPDCGALGIQMIDGTGSFLPESKRGFPYPIVSLYKLLGLSALFPRSKVFNQYALGFLPQHQNHPVPILAGAYMMVRHSILKQIGGFDEAFFMYGEDIDLSYRIQLTGYQNYYFGQSAIVHFKGESTKRGSLNYVRLFYNAMSLFVTKHLGGGKAKIFAILIQLAIIARAFLAVIKRLLSEAFLPLIDAVAIYLSLFITEKCWVYYVREGTGFYSNFVPYSLPIFSFIFLIIASLSGIYDNLYKPTKVVFASAAGCIGLLAAYALFPENIRYSRGVVLMGGVVAGLMIVGLRWLFITLKLIDIHKSETNTPSTIVVGDEVAYNEVVQLLYNVGLTRKIIGRIGKNNDTNNVIGCIDDFESIIRSGIVQEVIVCEGAYTNAELIQLVAKQYKNILFRFHARGSCSIVGSDSKTGIGETVSQEYNYQIAMPYFKRMKRLVDIGIAVFLLFTFPIQLLCFKKGWTMILNAIKVLMAKCTWVGYVASDFNYYKSLPQIKPAILSHFGLPIHAKHPFTPEGLMQINTLYAKDYDWWHDIQLIFVHYKLLGASAS